MPIRRHNLAGLGSALPKPDIESLVGLRPFVESPWTGVLRAQDKVSALSRRILLSWGKRGDAEWRVPNTDPTGTSRTHPDRTTWYVVARTRVSVTPGCFLQAHIAYVPSGETQRESTSAELAIDSMTTHRPDGAAGWIRVTVTWYDRASGSETTTVERFLEGSTLEYGAEDTTAGGLWRTLRQTSIDEIAPPDVHDDTSELARFSRHIVADIVVEHRGSPRVVDAHIHEIPVAVAFDVGSDDLFAGAAAAGAMGEPERRRLAVHEAGHAVVATLLGAWVEFAMLDPVGIGGLVRRTPVRGTAAIISAAGALAVNPDAVTAEDFDRAGGLADWPKTDPEARERARTLVLEHYAAILRVADALEAAPDHLLFGDEIAALIRGAG